MTGLKYSVNIRVKPKAQWAQTKSKPKLENFKLERNALENLYSNLGLLSQLGS
jgi:hypothetical protein